MARSVTITISETDDAKAFSVMLSGQTEQTFLIHQDTLSLVDFIGLELHRFCQSVMTDDELEEFLEVIEEEEEN